jgi:uncharacterized repeat protein (TIGR01451 family)
MPTKNIIKPALLVLALTMVATGCAQRRPAADTQTPVSTSTQPVYSTVSASSVQADFTTFDVKQGLVNVSKKLPKLLELGQDMTYSIQLQAQDTARNVTVREEIPASARYLRSEPEARVLGNQLIWSFPEMAKGSSKTLSVTLKPIQEGRIEGYTTVTVEPQAYAATLVGKPKLTLVKTGPSTAMVGKDVTYELKVSNNGTYVAKGVMLTDQVPQGLTHASKAREVVMQVGDLEPGQTKHVPVTFKAAQRGAVRNVTMAHSANAETVSAEANTLLLLQTVKVAAKGLDDQYVGKAASYEIVVNNPGDVPLKHVMVTDTMPPEGKILQATGAALSGNSASWSIGELAPGEEKKFSVVATTQTPGVHKNLVVVKTAEGVGTQGEYATLWRGLSGLSLQMFDSADPIKEGDMTEFNITLTNQGSAADTNIRVQVSFPAGLQPAGGGGATSATVSGQTVSFAPVASLAPKQSLSWIVQARGTTVGDNRTRVQYTSDSIKVPVTKDESTQVY